MAAKPGTDKKHWLNTLIGTRIRVSVSVLDILFGYKAVDAQAYPPTVQGTPAMWAVSMGGEYY